VTWVCRVALLMRSPAVFHQRRDRLRLAGAEAQALAWPRRVQRLAPPVRVRDTKNEMAVPAGAGLPRARVQMDDPRAGCGLKREGATRGRLRLFGDRLDQAPAIMRLFFQSDDESWVDLIVTCRSWDLYGTYELLLESSMYQ
jgi:hypothetical protein